MIKLNTLKRIEWLDIARGIAIILVVVGHSPATIGMKSLIYSFHIPLFFFLSGFVFNQQKYKEPKDFFAHKIKTLILPYFIFSFIEYLIYVLWENGIYNTNFTAFSVFVGIFYASASTMKIATVLWFLPCLFIVQSLFYLITKISTKHVYLVAVLVTSSIIGYFYGQYFNVRLPWFIDASFTALVFYGIGFIYKKYVSVIEEKISDYYTEIFLGSFTLLYIFSILNSRISSVDMFGLVYHNYFYYYLSASFGIMSCIMLSKIIKHSKLLSYIGENTKLLFVFHTNMFVIINYILGTIRNTYNIQFTVVSSVNWSLLYTFLSILLLVPIIITVNIIKKKSSMSHKFLT